MSRWLMERCERCVWVEQHWHRPGNMRRQHQRGRMYRRQRSRYTPGRVLLDSAEFLAAAGRSALEPCAAQPKRATCVAVIE